jgi:hypothetical protein
MRRLYLYLASRSKDGIKIITVLQSDQPVNSDVSDLEELQLPATWQHQIQRIIHDNRMLFQPRVETAMNYEELKKTLKARGFKNMPMGVCPMLHLSGYVKAPVANTSSCKVQKTMLRKLKNG